jgi:hypothetical protein
MKVSIQKKKEKKVKAQKQAEGKKLIEKADILLIEK